MCGRYSIATDAQALQDAFDIVVDLTDTPDWQRYNLAPSQQAPVVRLDADGRRVLVLARWGLIPSWVKAPGELQKPVNAKAETAASKPMFRHAYRKSRVLVPASGFYEWKAIAGRKQPYYVALRSGGLFALGGLLEHWQGPEGPVTSFAVLTTTPNEVCAAIHDRMPVIVAANDYTSWLSPTIDEPERIATMTGPFPAERLRVHPVSPRVNSVRNDDPALIQPVELPAGEG